MIWYYIIIFIDGFLSSVLNTFGVPRVEKLPGGSDEWLVTAFGYFREFMSLYPPISILFTAMMIYFGFKLVLLILKNIPLVKITT